MRAEPEPDVDALAHTAIGAAIEVHRALGPGFAESVYESAIEIEPKARQVPIERQLVIPLCYRGQPIGQHRLDILVDRRLILELKAVEALSAVHQSQMVSYLRATGLRVGLLINFNVPVLRSGIKRIIAPTA